MLRSFFSVSVSRRSLVVRVLPALVVAIAIAVRASGGSVINGNITSI